MEFLIRYRYAKIYFCINPYLSTNKKFYLMFTGSALIRPYLKLWITEIHKVITIRHFGLPARLVQLVRALDLKTCGFDTRAGQPNNY